MPVTELDCVDVIMSGHQKDIFVNCPFDVEYAPMLEALLFVIYVCGFKPRCALEKSNSAKVRIDKIYSIIEECPFGVHDISRTELNENDLPRFNMPLELGIFLGTIRFGKVPHSKKECLILDVSKFRYQEYMSDIGGQDISPHENNPHKLIKEVRKWLNTCVGGGLPGGVSIISRFDAFQADRSALLEAMDLEESDVTYADQVVCIENWLSYYLV